MKTRDLADLPYLPPQDWRDIALRMVTSIRRHIQKDFYFRNKPYRKAYAEKKAENRALTGGATQASRSQVPDLTLTGKMMGALRVIEVTRAGCVIGWDGLNAEKVVRNAKMGRAITTRQQPLIPPVLAEVLKDVDSVFGRSVESYRRATNVKLVI